ncbi:MAG: hypothetical protein RI897_2652, partial [Verrucomicrobiota bacterium]
PTLFELRRTGSSNNLPTPAARKRSHWISRSEIHRSGRDAACPGVARRAKTDAQRPPIPSTKSLQVGSRSRVTANHGHYQRPAVTQQRDPTSPNPCTNLAQRFALTALRCASSPAQRAGPQSVVASPRMRTSNSQRCKAPPQSGRARRAPQSGAQRATTVRSQRTPESHGQDRASNPLARSRPEPVEGS